MTTFFQSIAAGLTGQNQSLNIDVQGLGDGQLKLLISANLGPIPENADTQETKLRVALSRRRRAGQPSCQPCPGGERRAFYAGRDSQHWR